MSMVMCMIVIFIITGVYSGRVDRWVIAGLTGAITLVVLVTYLRF